MLTLIQLKNALENRFITGEFGGKYVYLSEEPLNAGSELLIGRDAYAVENEAFLVIIGGMPGVFFHNPITYELHETATRKTRTITEPMMLSHPEKYPSLKLLFSQQQTTTAAMDTGKYPEEITGVEIASRQVEKSCVNFDSTSFHVPAPATRNRHAVLLGGGDADFPYDIAQLRDVLINRYAYDPKNIIVLLHHGSNFDELGLKVDGPANRNTVLDKISHFGIE